MILHILPLEDGFQSQFESRLILTILLYIMWIYFSILLTRSLSLSLSISFSSKCGLCFYLYMYIMMIMLFRFSKLNARFFAKVNLALVSVKYLLKSAGGLEPFGLVTESDILDLFKSYNPCHDYFRFFFYFNFP